jgi:hypothetical protein
MWSGRLASKIGEGEKIQEHGSKDMTVRLGTEYAAFWTTSNLCLSLSFAELTPSQMREKTLHWQINRDGQVFDIILDFRFDLEGIRGTIWH